MFRWFFPKINWSDKSKEDNELLYQAKNRQVLKNYCATLLPRWVGIGVLTNVWLYVRITLMHQINLWDINVAWGVLFVALSMTVLLFLMSFFLKKIYSEEDKAVEFLSSNNFDDSEQ